MRTHIWTNNALLHPIRAFKLRVRRWLLKDAGGNWADGPIPAYLQSFEVGESLPWKGVSFKVGKVVGGDFPVVILVPTDKTHGAKLRTLRAFRDLRRERRSERRQAARALERGTR